MISMPNPAISKLTRSVQAAERLGAQTVVVHPPFRWQRRYAEGFSDQVAELETRSDVMVAVENMFPFRADRFFGSGQPSIERMRKRGGRPGVGVSAFAPSYDPLDGNHAHYTLDLSHTATAGTDANQAPTPKATASAPTRPMVREEPSPADVSKVCRSGVGWSSRESAEFISVPSQVAGPRRSSRQYAFPAVFVLWVLRSWTGALDPIRAPRW